MNGVLLHAFFFLVLSVPIVVMSAFYAEPEDGPALRSIPKRYAVFVIACAVLAGAMLGLEALFV